MATPIQLARTLHPRLLRFFAKYPPVPLAQIQASTTNPPPSPAAAAPSPPPAAQSDSTDATTTTTSTPPPSTPTVTETTNNTTRASRKQSAYPRSAPPQNTPYHNPFLPRKIFSTGKWQSPVFSLRQQAELCALARKHDVEDWLPYSPKKAGEKLRRRLERGLEAGPTGKGQVVKGHKWERQLESKLERRRVAMEKMPELIAQWRERGRGKGWKKWPK